MRVVILPNVFCLCFFWPCREGQLCLPEACPGRLSSALPQSPLLVGLPVCSQERRRGPAGSLPLPTCCPRHESMGLGRLLPQASKLGPREHPSLTSVSWPPRPSVICCDPVPVGALILQPSFLLAELVLDCAGHVAWQVLPHGLT